jgi:hypothetical protein
MTYSSNVADVIGGAPIIPHSGIIVAPGKTVMYIHGMSYFQISVIFFIGTY